jgi:glycolate oxidase iron-sulfur subunit
MARAVETCVHCGFCLPACPTYRVLGEEMDSPRGRIVLMKQVLEGTLAPDDAQPHIDRCLGCLGCVTACPSGVKYGELLVPFRARHAPQRTGRLERAWQGTMLTVLESPRLFRLAARAGALARPASRHLPRSLAAALSLLPSSLPPSGPLPITVPAMGPRRARVALLAGCVQQALAQEINHATVRVLARNGVEVVIPPAQGCCGALALHTGHERRATARASALMRALPQDVDAVVTNAAGCGSVLKEYDGLLRGTAEEAIAARFASRVKDIAEFLDALGLVDPRGPEQPMSIAYHDACHLAHGQGIRRAPRALLGRIPNVRVLEVPDGEICCGSAGTFNLEQPEMARELGARKAAAIRSTGADAVAAGNVGCLIQLATHLAFEGQAIPVLHTM